MAPKATHPYQPAEAEIAETYEDTHRTGVLRRSGDMSLGLVIPKCDFGLGPELDVSGLGRSSKSLEIVRVQADGTYSLTKEKDE